MPYLLQSGANVYPSNSLIPCFSLRNYPFIDSQILQFIYHSNCNMFNIFCMFGLVGGQVMYVNTLLHCHFLHTNPNPSFPTEQGPPPPPLHTIS